MIYYTISTAYERGFRPYQEDRHVVRHLDHHPSGRPAGLLMAVFDGHGGEYVAEELRKRLNAGTDDHFLLNGAAYIRRLTNVARACEHSVRQHRAGSTMSLVYIPYKAKKAYVAVLGDSPVIIRNGKGELWVSPEHNIRSNAAEADAALKRGGYIAQGYLFSGSSEAGLQMSRACGDSLLGAVLDREPEVFAIDIDTSTVILVGTDGLLDPGHADQRGRINHLFTLIDKDLQAKDLVDDAINLPTHDNVTAILWKGHK